MSVKSASTSPRFNYLYAEMICASSARVTLSFGWNNSVPSPTMSPSSCALAMEADAQCVAGTSEKPFFIGAASFVRGKLRSSQTASSGRLPAKRSRPKPDGELRSRYRTFGMELSILGNRDVTGKLNAFIKAY